MHDPEGAPNNQTIVATIPTRADHSNSEDGVLGMSLEPGFDLADPTKRDIFIYYSPRNPAWPTSGNAYTVGYNLISRFTMTADGTAFEAGSERPILQVPEGEARRQPDLVYRLPGRQRSRPRRRRRPGLRLERRPLPRRRRRRLAERGRARRLSAARLPRARSTATRARPRRTPTTCAARSSGSTRSTTSRRGPSRASGRPTPIPDGNMFAPGTANTRPEIYAMGFRQPFTLHTDPANPGTVAVGEYCHDAGSNAPNRAPAGGCEWNLIVTSPASTAGRSASPTTPPRTPRIAGTTPRAPRPAASTTARSRTSRPTSITRPRARATPAPPSRARPTSRAPRSRRRSGRRPPTSSPSPTSATSPAGGNQPITGPIYRFDEDAPPGRLPRVLRRLVADQQPRLRQRLLEGSPPARGQQPDAARP